MEPDQQAAEQPGGQLDTEAWLGGSRLGLLIRKKAAQGGGQGLKGLPGRQQLLFATGSKPVGLGEGSAACKKPPLHALHM